MVAVPLATQLSEALRAETASRKEIVDLESLLLHAEEGLKTQRASANLQYEVKSAKSPKRLRAGFANGMDSLQEGWRPFEKSFLGRPLWFSSLIVPLGAVSGRQPLGGP